jgi:isoamylase
MQGTGSDQRFWDLLTRTEQSALVALGRDKEYPPSAALCIQGDPATHVFVLLDGWVKVLSVTDDGREDILALRGDGDILGETAGEPPGRRDATVRAIGTVHALIVGNDRFSSFLDTHPGAGHAYRRVMTQRWNAADTMLRRRAITNGAQRLAGLILDLAARHGSGADSAIEVALPLSQEELASLAGASRATVARALSNWRNRGFIRTGQRRITITDLPGLQRAAGPAMNDTNTAWVRVLEIPKARSRPDTGQPAPAPSRLPEGGQPPAPTPEPVIPPERTVRLGAWITEDQEATEFAVFASHATGVDLCLVDGNGTEQRRIALSELQASAGVWHGSVRGAGAGQHYGYRVNGEYKPVSGHRFNAAKLLLDPYAKAIEGEVSWDQAVFSYPFGHPDRRNNADSAPYMPHSVVVDDAFDWADDRPPGIPWADTVIYEVHVRGFTKQHPLIPEGQRGTYAAMGSAPVIRYLRDLGITAVQLMSVHHFVSEHALIRRGLTNYWGYNPIGYFAPEASYSSSGTAGEQVREFKAMVRNLHAANIEVLLDVVFNHTAEGDHEGPHLCFRGIDNRLYYRLDSDQSRYKDYSGCGNSLNMGDPQVLALIMDSLRYWVKEMHVDGFHFDLASALARNLYEVGSLTRFMELLRRDPVISRVKLIAESWDLGEEGGYQVDNFPGLWAEFNDSYRDAVCSFWRGAPQPAEELARRLTGSADLCRSDGQGPGTSINFITYHDGFTLTDLVSYNEKRNEANGEDNRDGIEFNNSWNCGVEGDTGDAEIRKLRERQKRNLLTTLLLSASVPVLLAGDELGRTQQGNNNPYCQDNKVTWVDWEPDERGRELLLFTRDLIALRARHPVFRRRRPFHGREIRNTGMKDIGWFTPDGAEMNETTWRKRDIHTLGMFLNGQTVFDRSMQGERITGASFLLLFNAGSQTTPFTLPGPPWAASYTLIVDTYVPTIDTGRFPTAATNPAAARAWKPGDVIRLEAWSVVVLGISPTDQRIDQPVH